MENKNVNAPTQWVTLVAMMAGLMAGAFGAFFFLPESFAGTVWMTGLWVGSGAGICAMVLGVGVMLVVNSLSTEEYHEPVSLWHHYTPWEKRLEVGGWLVALAVFGSTAWMLEFEPMVVFMVACFTPPGIISIVTDYRAKKRLAKAGKKVEDVPEKGPEGET